MNRISAATFITFCYFLFTFGYIISTGFYHVGELLIILTVFLALLIFYLKPRILNSLHLFKTEKLLLLLLTLILIVFVAQVGARLGDSAQTNWLFFSAANRVLAAVALFLSITYLIKRLPLVITKYRFFSLILIAVFMRLFAIFSA